MIPQLDQVAGILDEASRSISAGQIDRACAHLAQAGSVLDQCVAAHCHTRLIDTITAAVMPAPVEQARQPESARALAMVAA